MEYFIVLGLVIGVGMALSLHSVRHPSPSLHAFPTSGEATEPSINSLVPTISHPIPSGDTVWVPSGQAIRISNRTIPDGLCYFGKVLPSVSGWGVEPALINPKLPVSTSHVDRTGMDVGPWPSYSEMSPASRAAYLEWCADGRNDPHAYIGYVFLHFFGLERRLFAPSEASEDPFGEARTIHGEVMHLAEVYNGYSHFRGCALRLLDAIEAVIGGIGDYTHLLTSAPRNLGFPLRLKVELGQQALRDEPVRPEQALVWVTCDSKRRLRLSAHHCRREFEKLFHCHYAERFGQGLRIQPDDSQLRAFYFPISPSFASPVELHLPDLPDVTAQEKVGDLFWEIAKRCTDELKPYNHWLTRNKNGESRLFAYAWAPSALAKDYEIPEVRSLAALLEHSVEGTDLLTIEAEALYEHWPMPAPQIPTTRDASALTQLLAKLGFGIEPDLRFGQRMPDPSGKAVIFRLPTEAAMSPSHHYVIALTMLRIAAAVSVEDEGWALDDALGLEEILPSTLHLTPAEAIRLRAYFRWMSKDPVDPFALRGRLEHLREKSRTLIVRFLASILVGRPGEGTIDSTLVSRLSRVLEFDPEQSSQDPSPISAGELARVTMILAGTFNADEVMPENVPHPQENRDALKLNEDDLAFFWKLTRKAVWPRWELEWLADKANVLLDGMIDKLNDAALRMGGELLLEGDDPVEINPKIVRMITP